MVVTRLLLAAPLLITLAVASMSPAPTAAVSPSAAAPSAAPQTPPATKPPTGQSDDTCTCPQQLLWEECEPAWHQDLRQSHAGARWLGRRPAPGSLHGPI